MKAKKERDKIKEEQRLRQRLAELTAQAERETADRRAQEELVERLRLEQRQREEEERRLLREEEELERKHLLELMVLKRMELSKLTRERDALDHDLYSRAVQIETIEEEKRKREERDVSDLNVVLERARVLKVAAVCSALG